MSSGLAIFAQEFFSVLGVGAALFGIWGWKAEALVNKLVGIIHKEEGK